MRKIEASTMNIRTVTRPTVEVVQFSDDQDSYTYQVVFNESIKTRIGKFSLKDAKDQAKAFKDWFNHCAQEIECGQERPYQIMGTVKDKFASEYVPQARADTSSF